MGYVFMIIAGAAAGWLAAIVQRAVNTRGVLVNIVAGVAGALVAGLVLSPALVGGGLGSGNYTADELLVSIAGSVFSVGAVSMLRDQQIL